jgi:tRNA/rRNA methyltransferase
MEQQQNLDRIEIVLVGTQDGANIGSCCRAMKTMGLTHLTLVTEREYAENRVRALAIHASDLWEGRKQYPTLEEALAGSVLTVAATRRHGKFRKGTCVTPEQLADQISTLGDGKVSIVFGRESDGLTDDEVNACAEVVTIPSSDKFPSLNLSQAVQVITYTLFLTDQTEYHRHRAGSPDAVITATDRVTEAMEAMGYFKLDDERRWTRQFLSDIFERAQMSETEIRKMKRCSPK